MAYVDAVQTNRGPMLFYNLDQAVGRGAQNLRSDVLLVQYFLREIFKANPTKRPPGEVLPSGFADETLYRWILHYQTETRKSGRLISTDGRVDHANAIRGSISGMQYTIIYMNVHMRQTRANDFEKLAEASDCPPELAPAIVPQWIVATQ